MRGSFVAVGRVVALYRYPVKSMRGEALDEAQMGWHGLAGDRRYAFVRPDNGSRFPWLTARKVPDLLRYVPRLVDPMDPEGSEIDVCTPEGEVLPLTSPKLGAQIVGRTRYQAQLLHLGVGAFDSMPVSLLALPALAEMSQALGRDVDARRFRPNVVVETFDGSGRPERDWVGASLAFGDDTQAVVIRVDRPDVRCMMIGLDPDTAAYDPAVLRHVVAARQGIVGVYGTPERPGALRVGAPVYLT